MAVPRDILEDLKTFVEVEIQAGRRMAPVDAEAAAACRSGAQAIVDLHARYRAEA